MSSEPHCMAAQSGNTCVLTILHCIIGPTGSIMNMTMILNITCTWTIYHQGIFHSLRRNPSLNCLHRRRSLAIFGHTGPRWRIRLSLHLVLGLPIPCPFSWCPLCRSFCPSVVFKSCNVSRPSMYSLLDNVYDIIYTCLMSYPGITFVVA